MLIPTTLLVRVLWQADDWRLNIPFSVGNRVERWAVTVESEIDGDPHHATFELTRTTKSSSQSKVIQTFRWNKLQIDDEEGVDIPSWDASVGMHGEILGMEGSTEDSYRRMLTPMVFPSPDFPVKIGYRWKSRTQPSGNRAPWDWDFEAKSTELVDGNLAIIVHVNVAEAGTNPMTGSGSWWLSKVGKVLKFEMKVNNWIVPMAGSEPTNVIIRGKTL